MIRTYCDICDKELTKDLDIKCHASVRIKKEEPSHANYHVETKKHQSVIYDCVCAKCSQELLGQIKKIREKGVQRA